MRENEAVWVFQAKSEHEHTDGEKYYGLELRRRDARNKRTAVVVAEKFDDKAENRVVDGVGREIETLDFIGQGEPQKNAEKHEQERRFDELGRNDFFADDGHVDTVIADFAVAAAGEKTADSADRVGKRDAWRGEFGNGQKRGTAFGTP